MKAWSLRKWRQNKLHTLGSVVEEKWSFGDEFLLLRDNTECFCLVFPCEIERVTGRHEWRKADMSGDCWGAKDHIMFFIYALISIVSLASKKNRPKSLTICPRCHSVLNFLSVNYTNYSIILHKYS